MWNFSRKIAELWLVLVAVASVITGYFIGSSFHKVSSNKVYILAWTSINNCNIAIHSRRLERKILSHTRLFLLFQIQMPTLNYNVEDDKHTIKFDSDSSPSPSQVFPTHNITGVGRPRLLIHICACVCKCEHSASINICTNLLCCQHR